MKGNAYLAKIAGRMHEEKELTRVSTQIWCKDMTVLTLGRLGFGPKRINEFLVKYREVWTDYADMVSEDAKDDKEIIYSKAKMDEELKQYRGPDFKGYEDRYRPVHEMIKETKKHGNV